MKKYFFKLGKTMKKYIFVLIASLMAIGVNAQTMTPQEEREFYQKAYAVISDYAQSATVYNDQKANQFRNLFVRSDIQICNDLMSLSDEPTLTIDNYIKALRTAKSVNVTVKNVRKGQITDKGDTWEMPIRMEKSISYVNGCGTYFDSQAYFKKDYKVVATMSLDKSTGRCRISALDADGERIQFPKNYTVLVKKDERDNKLTIDGAIVQFNPYDQVMLHPGYKIKYLGSDVEEELVKGECDRKIHAGYNDRTFRVRLNGGFAVTNFNKLSNAGDGLEAKSAGEMSFGVDLGYVFPSKGRLQTGVFVGVGISKSSLEMEYKPSGDIVAKNVQDIDGDTYDRYYENVNGFTQKMEASNIAIPLYLDLEYRVAPAVSVYADLGVKAYLSGGDNTATTKGYTTKGVYSKYNNLEIKDIPELGLTSYSGGSIEVDETGVKSKTAIDALLGLGLRYNIGKSVAVDAGVQYLTGTKSWESTKGEVMTYAGVDKVNLLRKSEGITHGALKATVSLIYKF